MHTKRFDPKNWSCGHERTEENTRRCGEAGLRCKKCRDVIGARHRAKKKAIREQVAAA